MAVGQECVIAILGPHALKSSHPGMSQKMQNLETKISRGMANNKIDLERIHIGRGPFGTQASQVGSEAAFLKQAKDAYPGLPVLVMTPGAGEAIAIAAMTESGLTSRGRGWLIVPTDATSRFQDGQSPFVFRLGLRKQQDLANNSYDFHPDALYQSITQLTELSASEGIVSASHTVIEAGAITNPTSAARSAREPVRLTTAQKAVHAILHGHRKPHVAGHPRPGHKRRRG